ncbi:hypothetical protein C0992_007918 [Termitomyces sp. T32_za158]|nr:hypothetical protein C0992_007918 [Termitomyces sp. T32_za158]
MPQQILSPSIHHESFDQVNTQLPIPFTQSRAEMIQMPPGLTLSARSPSQISTNTVHPPATSRKRSRSFSPDEFRPRRPPPEPIHQSNANGSTSSPIESLLTELQIVRGRITGALGHEAAIIWRLDALGHSVPPRETSQETALREKLQALEAQLQAETRMRTEAENALKDFQRECREPFLVPALIQQEAGDERLS